TQMPSMQALFGFSFTMILSSIVAMLCYFWLIRRLAASTVSLSNVMTPVIALVLGATLNNEHISSNAFVGIVIVMFGTQMPSMQALFGFSFTMILSSIVAMLCYFWLIRR
ncbi:EamA family transporter, partial [Staphylococcus aureus]|uniref:EamA family transporter n=1 Tax=Staphylococcus aureus TaxID=1280 RepID=UPI001C838267